MANDHEKELAAPASLAYVRDGYVVGLGTGSTAAPMVRVRAGMKIRGIPFRSKGEAGHQPGNPHDRAGRGAGRGRNQ